MINARGEKILAEYRPQSKNYTYRAFSDKDLNMLEEVCSSISQESDELRPEAIKKFHALKKILEKAFLEDRGLSHSLDRQQKFSRAKVAKLSASYEAAKIFMGSGEGADFDRVIQGILGSVSDKQIRSRIEEANKSLILAAKELSIARNPQLEAFQETLDIVVQQESIQAARSQVELDVIPAGTYEMQQAQKLSLEYQGKALQLLKDLKTPGWFSDYSDIGQLVRGSPISENEKNLPVKRRATGGDIYADPTGVYTYSDGYRAFSIFWDTFVETNYPRVAQELVQSPQRDVLKGHQPIKDSSEVLTRAIDLQTLQSKIESWKAASYRYTIEERKLGNGSNVDLLSDQSLFKFYQSQSVDMEKNQQLSDGAYSHFLPIFIASFTSIGDRFGAETLRKYKGQLFKRSSWWRGNL